MPNGFQYYLTDASQGQYLSASFQTVTNYLRSHTTWTAVLILL